MEKELELIKTCNDTLQVCAILPESPEIEKVKVAASNILLRYMLQLDVLTRPNEKPLRIEIDEN